VGEIVAKNNGTFAGLFGKLTGKATAGSQSESTETLSISQQERLAKIAQGAKIAFPAAAATNDPIEWAKSVAKPAIGLTRIYPISNAKNQRSHIGGLPDLPDGMEWPRMNDPDYGNDPLHFMAQVDLAELPWRHPVLPATGTLLFFAVFDADMDWSGEKGFVQVCFDPTSSGTPQQPPEDLGPAQGGYSHFDSDFLLPDEKPSPLIHSWPLQATTIKSYPGSTVRPKGFLALDGMKYDEHMRELQAEFFKNTYSFMDVAVYNSHRSRQLKLENLGWVISHATRPETLSELCFDEAVKVKRFIELWLRYAYKHFDRGLSILGIAIERKQTDINLADVELLRPVLRPLIAEIESCSNQNWLGSLLQAKTRKILPPISDFFYDSIDREFGNILRQTVRECGKDRELAELIPHEWLMVAQNEHVALRPSHFKGESPELHFHQMFGHIRTTQWETDVDNENICLLQLRTDYGSNLMICDVGEMEFWIKPEDLAILDFSKVWGTTQGG
jgi:uncharacterized protein YwqG